MKNLLSIILLALSISAFSQNDTTINPITGAVEIYIGEIGCTCPDEVQELQAVTEVNASRPIINDMATLGQMDLDLSIKLQDGSTVPTGECLTFNVYDNLANLVYTTNLKTGDPISSSDNYIADYFPNGSDVLSDGSIITFVRDGILKGNDATNLNFELIVGGTCAGVTNPTITNQSTTNTQGSSPFLRGLGFENSKLKYNEDEAVNNAFIAMQNSSYLGNYIGSVISVSQSNLVQNSASGFFGFVQRDDCNGLITDLETNTGNQTVSYTGADGWGNDGGLAAFQTIATNNSLWTDIAIFSSANYEFDPADDNLNANVIDNSERHGSFSILYIYSDEPILQGFTIEGCSNNTTLVPGSSVQLEVTELFNMGR